MDDNTLTIKADGREFTFPKSEAWKVLSQVSEYTKRQEVREELDAIADRDEDPMTDEEFDELVENIVDDIDNCLDDAFGLAVRNAYDDWRYEQEAQHDST